LFVTAFFQIPAFAFSQDLPGQELIPFLIFPRVDVLAFGLDFETEIAREVG